jgi:hypothetical protein
MCRMKVRAIPSFNTMEWILSMIKAHTRPANGGGHNTVSASPYGKIFVTVPAASGATRHRLAR